MTNEILKILEMMADSFIQLWPYLLLTIPLSVAVHVSGASKFINRALSQKPYTAILLAAVVGAFSPFCSCGVIPIVTTLLVGGVPLAPIMTFWIASPSMDPEIFFLSAGMLGWDIAVWRLISTLLLSMSAGYLTKYLSDRKWFGENIISINQPIKVNKFSTALYNRSKVLLKKVNYAIKNIKPGVFLFHNVKSRVETSLCCAYKEPESVQVIEPKRYESRGKVLTDSNEKAKGCSYDTAKPESFRARILKETWNASYLVAKFMSLAFLVKALIVLYAPSGLILNYIGGNNPFSVFISTFIGIPFYVNNLAALPMISGFLQQGMDSGAALAFLIAGPITTLPAMAAVWGITNKKVFAFYLAVPIIGALLFGYLMSIFY